jgi:oligoendopeptidase F
MQQQAAQVYTELQTATAYMRPEILVIGRPTIERFIAEESRLAQYRMFLDDILRAAPHTLTPPEEKILARAGLLAQAGGAVHSVFTNADLPYPEVTLSTGEKVRLDASAYGKYRASPVKADRDAVFAAFWGRYGEFTRTLATTLNENLLFHHVLDRTKDDRTRLFLLASYLDTMRTTLFRQTLFAEFELRIHEAVERGEPLTGEALSKLYLELLRKYYGHDQGIVDVAEPYGAEWAYIPHFYSNFYVYQYATSLIGGMSLAENIIGKDAVKSGRAAQGREAYLRLLKAGSSKYPVDLLKDAGVDMTTSQPFDAAMREMNRIMDEIERIHARQKG